VGERYSTPNEGASNHHGLTVAVQGLVQPSKRLPMSNQHPKLSAKHIPLLVLHFI
jgi:hypothetical protein